MNKRLIMGICVLAILGICGWGLALQKRGMPEQLLKQHLGNSSADLGFDIRAFKKVGAYGSLDAVYWIKFRLESPIEVWAYKHGLLPINAEQRERVLTELVRIEGIDKGEATLLHNANIRGRMNATLYSFVWLFWSEKEDEAVLYIQTM